MRRGPAVLIATAAITAALVSFHPHKRAATGIAATTGSAKPAATATAGASRSNSSSRSSSSASAARSFTGSVAQTQYGPVQVKVTVKAGRVTDVEAVQIPLDNPRSAEINQYAAPLLRSEALKAQSASIDAVSGASYTSEGYDASLQSALGQAGIS